MAFTMDDLTVANSLDVIRRWPEKYAGPAPRAKRLAGKTIADLLCFGVESASVEAFGAWWLIVAQHDWLTLEGTYHAEYWHTVRAAPEVGLQADRPEAVLTALSKSLFTIADSSIEFIVGNDEISSDQLRKRILSLLDGKFRGRAIGFWIDE
jgi:hypothetical protein